MKVYIVMVRSECDDNVYPDYHTPVAVFSTEEKAEKFMARLDEENKHADRLDYTGSWIWEMELDKKDKNGEKEEI